ncbi:hypothetical protein KVR01_012590 [Diaporthe batatas]|uniref:uncharacterized protein n=1 Tax=Diaporthe batatas TaxID=748121 RepID=UPI001D053012|nr:uncharacterized protein KVR01_012590 [Diaporthe batatas]KAG8157548.1 hypothetical protein KVR01_012590 [Diaporthe batatas]
MEVRIGDAKTTAALEQDGHLRCLLMLKYKHRDRHSVPSIAWARRKAEEVSRGLLNGAGLDPETANFTVSMNMVSLGERRHHSYICYDLYLEKCSSETRDTIDRSTRRPIHVISKRGDVLIARRDPKLDEDVGARYEGFQELDKGPRPYFSDSENPPLYNMALGRRVEEPWVKDADNNVEDDVEDDVDDGKDYGDEGEGEGDWRPDQGREDGKGSNAQTAEAET